VVENRVRVGKDEGSREKSGDMESGKFSKNQMSTIKLKPLGEGLKPRQKPLSPSRIVPTRVDRSQTIWRQEVLQRTSHCPAEMEKR